MLLPLNVTPGTKIYVREHYFNNCVLVGQNKKKLEIDISDCSSRCLQKKEQDKENMTRKKKDYLLTFYSFIKIMTSDKSTL